MTAAICRVLIGLLLFTQAAFAARPCVEAEMSAASVLAAAQDHGCCDTSVSKVNLCVMKCTDGDKLSAHTPLVVPPRIDQAALKLAPLDDARAQSRRCGLDIAARDPPKTIRFCSLLI